jgi:3,4-dihydroxy 2-butanone 4-phosphate synthase/GTP cyclohydrolase II
VLVDDEDRENEGDLVYAAEKVTPAAMNFMLTHARGVVCLALTGERATSCICIRRWSEHRAAGHGVHRHHRCPSPFGVTTGVSAKDRATTVQVAIAEDAQPQDLLRPGHINPLRARDGGVLVRAGQTEGSVDLARWRA